MYYLQPTRAPFRLNDPNMFIEFGVPNSHGRPKPWRVLLNQIGERILQMPVSIRARSCEYNAVGYIHCKRQRSLSVGGRRSDALKIITCDAVVIIQIRGDDPATGSRQSDYLSDSLGPPTLIEQGRKTRIEWTHLLRFGDLVASPCGGVVRKVDDPCEVLSGLRGDTWQTVVLEKLETAFEPIVPAPVSLLSPLGGEVEAGHEDMADAMGHIFALSEIAPAGDAFVSRGPLYKVAFLGRSLPSWSLEGMSTAAAATVTPSGPTRHASRDVQVAIWPIVTVLYATLLPREIRFYVGDLAFYADRIGLLLALPWVIKKLMDGAIRFVLPDILVFVASGWMVVSMIVHYGFSAGLQSGGSQALDATVGYFLARISFRSLRDIRLALIFFAPGVFLAGMSMMVESVLQRPIIEPLAQSIFGPLPLFEGGVATGETKEIRQMFRLGLMRAKGPFSHSILGGIYMSSLASLYLLSGIRGWPKLLGTMASLFSVFSISSAALIGLFSSLALTTYEWLQEHVRELSWTILIVIGLTGVLTLELVSHSGLSGIVARYLTLDRGTAYYRQLIWQFGSASVWAHPLFGIGYADYDRPLWMINASVDAHWLLLAMRFGVITASFYLAAVVLALFSLGQASTHALKADRKFFRGIAIALFVMTISMFTVTLWGGALNWFTILLGGCVACSQHSFNRFKITS